MATRTYSLYTHTTVLSLKWKCHTGTTVHWSGAQFSTTYSVIYVRRRTRQSESNRAPFNIYDCISRYKEIPIIMIRRSHLYNGNSYIVSMVATHAIYIYNIYILVSHIDSTWLLLGGGGGGGGLIWCHGSYNNQNDTGRPGHYNECPSVKKILKYGVYFLKNRNL